MSTEAMDRRIAEAAPDADPDQDGLDSQAEVSLGTDPLSPDTDGDGLMDGDEVTTYNSDPLQLSTTGDGVSDLVKVLEQVDPRAKLPPYKEPYGAVARRRRFGGFLSSPMLSWGELAVPRATFFRRIIPGVPHETGTDWPPEAVNPGKPCRADVCGIPLTAASPCRQAEAWSSRIQRINVAGRGLSVLRRSGRPGKNPPNHASTR